MSLLPRRELPPFSECLDEVQAQVGIENLESIVILEENDDPAVPGNAWVELISGDPESMTEQEHRTLGVVGLALLHCGAHFPSPQFIPSDKVKARVSYETLDQLKKMS